MRSMEKEQIGYFLAVIGAILFLVGLFCVLPLPDLYVLALLTMFVGAILVGSGWAIANDIGRGLDTPSDVCYYCNGSGRIRATPDGSIEPCPRCGGSGLARPEDAGE